jgi:hypothetical protein
VAVAALHHQVRRVVEAARGIHCFGTLVAA